MLTRRQQGLTLVELMISLTVSMIIVSGLLNLYLSAIESGKSLHDSSLLTQEVRALRGVLVSDIRRAGFWAWDPVTGPGDIWNNPFVAVGSDLSIAAASGEPADSCILYSYDLNKNGSLDVGENFGFRLSAKTVQAYDSGAFSCTDGTWTNLTSPELNVSALTFSLRETCLDVLAETTETCPCDTGDVCQHIRSVDMNLAASLALETSLSHTLSDSIHIRNDKFVSSAP